MHCLLIVCVFSCTNNTASFSLSKVKILKSAYYSICDDYGVHANEIWMDGD